MKQWSKPEMKNLTIDATASECLRTSGAATFRLPQWKPEITPEQIEQLKKLGWDALCCACDRWNLSEALSKYCDCLDNPNWSSC